MREEKVTHLGLVAHYVESLFPSNVLGLRRRLQMVCILFTTCSRGKHAKTSVAGDLNITIGSKREGGFSGPPRCRFSANAVFEKRPPNANPNGGFPMQEQH